jgi:hypothetical protein
MALFSYALTLLVGVNLALFFAVSQITGQILPHSLAGYYAATATWQRALVAGAIYAAIIVPFAQLFAQQPAAASFIQAIFGGLFVLAMVVVVGGKPLSGHMLAATVLIVIGSAYLAWASS